MSRRAPRKPRQQHVTPELRVAYRVCAFAHGSCVCERRGDGRPCEAVMNVVRSVFSMAIIEVERRVSEPAA